MMPWMKHFSACCELIHQAFEAGNRAGDLTNAAYSRLCLNAPLIAAGGPLREVQIQAESGLNFAQKAKFGLVADMINTQLGLIRTLRGLTAEFGSFDHAEFDEIGFELRLDSQPPLVHCWYRIRKLQAYFFADDFALAIEASLKARPLLWTSPTLELAEYEFYGALARAACCDAAMADQSQEHFDALEAHYKQLETWAKLCPENFESRATLVGAEIARIERRALDAEQLYEQAIRSARANGFVQNEALAYEAAARFYAARGLAAFAELYLVKARDGYRRWGADGKVRQLEARHPWLAATEPRGGMGAATPDQQLDVAAVVQASQALSSEAAAPVDRATDDHRPAECGRRSWLADLAQRA
jgi:hypothetical protein